MVVTRRSIFGNDLLITTLDTKNVIVYIFILSTCSNVPYETNKFISGMSIGISGPNKKLGP
jgi:hypothetical protein